MLTEGNQKLGILIHTFSLPAKLTCPGATERCRGVCYATKGHFTFDSVQQLYRSNLERSRQDNFPEVMVREIRRRHVRVLRVHVSGDFYDQEYIRKWIRIAKRLPQVKFYAYTRSWRDSSGQISGMYPDLLELGELRNFELWFSEDAESGQAPRIRGIRRCYMAVEADEEPPWRTHLVFRDKTKGVRKYVANGALVCPYENGATRKSITCSSCKLCWSHVAIPAKRSREEATVVA